MTGTYEKLMDDLELVDRDDPLTEVIAKGVIEAARLGVHDGAEMCLSVLNALGKPH